MGSRLTYAADIVIILICMAGIYHVHEKAGLPVVFDHNSLVIERVTHASFTLHERDTLLAIDGVPVSSIDDVEFLLDGKAVGHIATLSLMHDGAHVLAGTPLVRYFSVKYIIIQMIVTSIFIFLAMFVFTRRKEDEAARVFNSVTMCAALIIATTWGRYTVVPYGLGLALRGVFTAAYAMAPLLFVHFTMVFPAVRHTVVVKKFPFFYAAALAAALGAWSCFLAAARSGDLEWFRLYNTIFNDIRIFFVVCMLLGIANIIHTYATAHEESQRRQLRWILVGLAIGPLCFILLWVVPNVTTSRGIVDEEYILLTMLSVPVSFAIAIVKYHLLNIDQIFARGSVYAAVIFLILMIYIAIVGLSTFIIGTLTVTSSLTVSIVAAVVIALVFQPVRERMQELVDKHFFHVRYNYREAEKEFTDTILHSCDAASICATLVDTVNKIIPNLETRVFLIDGSDRPRNEQLIRQLREHAAPIAVNEHMELGADFVPASPGSLDHGDTAIVFRIYSDTSDLLGALQLGPKRSGFRFNLEDIDLLKSFCHQTAQTLDRVNLQHTLISEQLEKNRFRYLNDLKSYFVSSVTHELKTPLTSITMFSELIEAAPKLSKAKRDEYLAIIKSESARLSRLIDNVLDIARIEKGITRYRMAEIELNGCVKEAVRTMEHQLTLNGFECRTRLSRKHLPLFADRDAVLEVLINLITNAIKYSSKQKKIVITTRGTECGPRLEIEDFGVGIAPGDLQRIFEPFERTASAASKNTAGTGLGLALVKHIAEAHNARLEVESEPGRGTKFSITFPFTTTQE